MTFMNKNAHGFTIVELLIVIVVIGILAAVSIVAYNGVSNRANDAAIQADLRALAGKINEYHILNGSYPVEGATSAAFPGGIRHAANKQAYLDGPNLYYCVVPSGTNSRFALAAKSKSGSVFSYSGGSFQNYSGSVFSSGTNVCPGSGVATTEPGFEYHYGKAVNNVWSSWTNG